jgi:hypothetical protein
MTPHTLDERKINRDAVASLTQVMDKLYAYNGKPSGEILALNPTAPPKRIREFKYSQYDGGWRHLSDGASGKDPISFVEYFASVDRPTAAAFLAKVVKGLETA